MSSIYVSIPSLYDPELIPTIKSCLHQASKQNKIIIGVAFSTFIKDLNVYEIAESVSKFDNVRFKIFDCKDSIGLAASRKNAYSLYDGEDYLLQIDAHSFFKKNWDIELIEKLNCAKNLYGKCVLTCYPPSFFYKNGKRFLPYSWRTWSTNLTNQLLSDERYDKGHENFWDFLPHWYSEKLNTFEDDLKIIPKISGGFIFGDKEFASNYANLLPYNYMFFEEEIIETIELLFMEFELISLSTLPIAHLYSNDLEISGFSREILNVDFLYSHVFEIKNNFINYCNDNKNKIDLFSDRINRNMFEIINNADLEWSKSVN